MTVFTQWLTCEISDDVQYYSSESSQPIWNLSRRKLIVFLLFVYTVLRINWNKSTTKTTEGISRSHERDRTSTNGNLFTRLKDRKNHVKTDFVSPFLFFMTLQTRTILSLRSIEHAACLKNMENELKKDGPKSANCSTSLSPRSLTLQSSVQQCERSEWKFKIFLRKPVSNRLSSPIAPVQSLLETGGDRQETTEKSRKSSRLNPNAFWPRLSTTRCAFPGTIGNFARSVLYANNKWP